MKIFEQNGLYGLKDNEGNIVVPAIHRHISDESDVFIFRNSNQEEKDLLGFGSDEDQYGAYRHDGTVLIPVGKYDYISTCSGGFIVRKNGKEGLIGLDGDTEILPVEYDRNGIEFVGDDLIIVEKNSEYGLIRRDGSIVLPLEYDKISRSDSFIGGNSNIGDLLVVQKGSDFLGSEEKPHKGILDYNGNIILPVEYDYLEVTDEGNIVARKEQYAVYSHDGAVLVPFGKFDYISSSPGGFIVRKNDKEGLIGLDGDTEILPVEYNRNGIEFVGDDMIIIEKNEKYGLIRRDGSIVLPLEYGYISRTDSFKDGNRIVKKDNKQGVVQIDGNFLLPVEYDDLTTYSKEYDGLDCYFAEKNDKKGVFLPDGTALTELIYDDIIIYENGLIVKKDNSYYLLSLTGKDLGQCKADENGVYSPDGTTLLVFLNENPVIKPEVKTCRTIKNRNAIDSITFAEGHMVLDESWDYDGWCCIDHDPSLEVIVLPSTIKQISGKFFSQAYPKIKVPQGMVDYFRGIVPERLKEKVVE